MKKRVNIFMLIVCTLMFGHSATLHAQEEQVIEAMPETSVDSYTIDARQARISGYRQTYKISLQPDEKKLVSERCKAAQVKLRAQESNLKLVTSARKASYDEVIVNLSILQTRLAAGQGDNSNLDLLVVLYQQKVSAFENASSQYATALNDVSTLECTSNPEDFRAALEGARFARKEVVGSVSAINEITKSSLKTTLDSVKARLGTK